MILSWTRPAESDLVDILDYIADDGLGQGHFPAVCQSNATHDSSV